MPVNPRLHRGLAFSGLRFDCVLNDAKAWQRPPAIWPRRARRASWIGQAPSSLPAGEEQAKSRRSRQCQSAPSFIAIGPSEMGASAISAGPEFAPVSDAPSCRQNLLMAWRREVAGLPPPVKPWRFLKRRSCPWRPSWARLAWLQPWAQRPPWERPVSFQQAWALPPWAPLRAGQPQA